MFRLHYNQIVVWPRVLISAHSSTVSSIISSTIVSPVSGIASYLRTKITGGQIRQEQNVIRYQAFIPSPTPRNTHMSHVLNHFLLE